MKKIFGLYLFLGLVLQMGNVFAADAANPCSSIPSSSDKDDAEVKTLLKQIQITCLTQQLAAATAAGNSSGETTAEKIKALADGIASWKSVAVTPADVTTAATNLSHIGNYKEVQLLKAGAGKISDILVEKLSIKDSSKTYLLSTNAEIFSQRTNVQSVIRSFETQKASIADAVLQTKNLNRETMLVIKSPAKKSADFTGPKAATVPAISAVTSLVPAIAGAVSALKAKASYFSVTSLDLAMANHVIENTLLNKTLIDNASTASKSGNNAPTDSTSARISGWLRLSGINRGGMTSDDNKFGKAHSELVDALKKLKIVQLALLRDIEKFKNKLSEGNKKQDSLGKDDKAKAEREKVAAEIKDMDRELESRENQRDTNKLLIDDAEAAEKLLQSTPTGATVSAFAMLWATAETTIPKTGMAGTVLVFPVQRGSNGMLVARNFLLHDKLVYENSLSLAVYAFNESGKTEVAEIVQLNSSFTRNQIDSGGWTGSKIIFEKDVTPEGNEKSK